MQKVINSIIENTKNLSNLENLGVLLAKENDIHALKTLKLLVLAKDAEILNRDIDVNKIVSVEDSSRENKASVVSNLSLNPQNYALEFLEYLVQTKSADMHQSINGNGYSIFVNWIISLARIEDRDNLFYHRYDMVAKKMDIVNFLFQEGMLTENDVDYVFATFERCLQNKYGYSEVDLYRMQKLRHEITEKEGMLRRLTSFDETLPYNLARRMVFGETILENKKELALRQLSAIEMPYDQLDYINSEIPNIIKAKKLQ